MAREKQIYDEMKGERIKKARTDMNMSRQQLADALAKLSFSSDEYKNISGSLSAVKSWEGIGRKYSPDNTTLKAIAEILNVDFEWLLHGTVKDIIESTRRILDNFNPSKWEMVTYDNSIFYYNGKAIPNDIVAELCVLYPLIRSGHSINEIYDKKQYCEYMESTTKNSIEFYMKNLNKKG